MKNPKMNKKSAVFAISAVIICFITAIALIGCCNYHITLKTGLAFIACVLFSNGLSHFSGKISEYKIRYKNREDHNKGDAYEKEMV